MLHYLCHVTEVYFRVPLSPGESSTLVTSKAKTLRTVSTSSDSVFRGRSLPPGEAPYLVTSQGGSQEV